MAPPVVQVQPKPRNQYALKFVDLDDIAELSTLLAIDIFIQVKPDGRHVARFTQGDVNIVINTGEWVVRVVDADGRVRYETLTDEQFNSSYTEV